MSERIFAIPLRTRGKDRKETYFYLTLGYLMDTCVKMLAKYFSISASQSLIGDAGNELCSHITDYPLLLSVKGLAQFGAKNTLLAFARCEMSTLCTSQMWRMSRGLIFDLSVLSM